MNEEKSKSELKQSVNRQAGKGPRPRPVKGEVYRNNFENVFGKRKQKSYEPLVPIKPVAKKKETLCPHCGSTDLVKHRNALGKECRRCGWQL